MIVFASLLLLSLPQHAADSAARHGRLRGSLETVAVRYMDDAATAGRQAGWGANNYLKLDWQRDSLAAGLQAEWYPAALAGYPSELKGAGLTGIWLGWMRGPLRLTAGSFHDQLGSGLAMRAWEDRDIGINNCILGARAEYRTPAMEARIMGGFPKFGLGFFGHGALAACDVSVDVLAMGRNRSGHSLRLECSVSDQIKGAFEDGIELLAGIYGFSLPAHVASWSGRLDWSWRDLSLKGEYVGRSPDFSTEALPGNAERYVLKGGNAQLLELDYARGGFSGAITLRRLENMGMPIFHSSAAYSVANTLNYLPSLCARQTYMLADLNPYVTLAEGEAGIQWDVFYNFRRGTHLGGRHGMKLHVGGSWVDGLPCALPDRDVPCLAYREINVDIERRWTRRFSTILFVSVQENSPTHGNGKATNAQNVAALDALYRFGAGTSLRMELQYLYSQELTRDWMAALVELSFAPHWAVSASDMYNHGSTGVHYYNLAVGWSHSSFNITLSAGRNREGMVCSGGVCRWQPAWSGAGVHAQWSF